LWVPRYTSFIVGAFSSSQAVKTKKNQKKNAKHKKCQAQKMSSTKNKKTEKKEEKWAVVFSPTNCA
jgi:hypothetical protein